MLGLLSALATGSLATPYVLGSVVGFATGAFGHLIRSSAVILLGILIIGLTALLFIINTYPHS